LTALSSIRDLLTPGIWSLNQSTRKLWDISIDFSADALYLISDAGERLLLFTRKDIDDGTYKVDFRPKAMKIMGIKEEAGDLYDNQKEAKAQDSKRSIKRAISNQ
jgi:hypothetical protein